MRLWKKRYISLQNDKLGKYSVCTQRQTHTLHTLHVCQHLFSLMANRLDTAKASMDAISVIMCIGEPKTDDILVEIYFLD
jgi:hypothetical protein